MTKEQLIQIAKAGFPDRVKKSLNFANCEIHVFSNIYRLYDVNHGFSFMLPNTSYLAIITGEHKFIQFTTGNLAFNHYAAIKEMEKLNLI